MNINTLNIPIKLLYDDAKLPEYKFFSDAGCDLFCHDDVVTISVGEIKVINTGVAIKIPYGFEAQIRPRSGLAIKQGLSIINTPATIDSDYIGELMVGVINLGKDPVIINKGERFAQLVISPVYKAVFHQVDELENTLRGSGGFGHTGK